MEPNSQDQFKINYLRQRIAQITIQYEDAIANHVLQTQILTQEVERLNAAQTENEVEDDGSAYKN
jgi:hypothetical protein